MKGDMEVFSSEILGMKLCKSAESLQHFACRRAAREETMIRQIGRTD